RPRAVDTLLEVLGPEVAAAKIPLGPGGLLGQRAGEASLIEWHARDHRDVELAAEREELVLRGLIEDVVDHLHRVDDSGTQRFESIPRLPAVETDADGSNQSLSLEIQHRALPPLVVGPRILPYVELHQVHPPGAEVLECLL